MEKQRLDEWAHDPTPPGQTVARIEDSPGHVVYVIKQPGRYLCIAPSTNRAWYMTYGDLIGDYGPGWEVETVWIHDH